MDRYGAYLRALRSPFYKLCRLRFLQPDGSTAFTLDNNPRNQRSRAFIADGTITGNWQNGRRRSASVTLDNAGGDYEYNVNNVWFGTEIALDEGLILPDGTDYYIQQGVFLVETPEEMLSPAGKTVTFNLVDKVANLDGTLLGNLEGTYEVAEGTNIFSPIAALLREDRGNGLPLDRVTPIFTEYYNGRPQTLPDGSTALLTNAPYTLTVEGDRTKWDVILGLAAMLNAWVGYDETGALRVDPSQDDILDTDKPVLWSFSLDDAQIMGATYSVQNSAVFNDYIVVGEQLESGYQPSGRAQILDPRSPVNIAAIGRKTKRVSMPGYVTDKQCVDYATWMVKRASVLQRSVSISCSQMFHIRGNDICEIVRSDKPGNPTEKHLIQGFSRPLAGTGEMTISAVSTQDFPCATVSSWNE